MKIIKDIRYSQDSEQCRLDAYLPERENAPSIVYFHGGGLEGGQKGDECYVGLATALVKRGYAFFSVEYRLYTNGAKFPEYLVDCAKAVAFVKDNYAKGQLFVSGQSAGAWISLMLCLDKKYLADVGLDSACIDGWIIDSAQTTSHYNVLKFEKGLEPRLQRIDEFAPLYYVDENTDFSKMLIFFYEEDIPCRLEQNMLFIKDVLHFNGNANIKYKCLPGGHCHGSTHTDEDGEYPVVKEMLKWFEEKEV